MPRVADFRIFNDRVRRLEPGNSVELTCEIPPILCHSSQDPQSYVCLKFKLEGASGLLWELHLNGTLLLRTAGSGSNLLTTIEAFDPQLLLPGENTFDIRVKQGLGAVHIEDAVVHYHIEI